MFMKLYFVTVTTLFLLQDKYPQMYSSCHGYFHIFGTCKIIKIIMNYFVQRTIHGQFSLAWAPKGGIIVDIWPVLKSKHCHSINSGGWD